MVTFAHEPDVTKYDVYDVSRKLRERGWLVPAYTMPPKREDLAVLRVVVRNGFSHDMAELFLRDLRTAVDWLDDLDRADAARGPAQQLPPLTANLGSATRQDDQSTR